MPEQPLLHAPERAAEKLSVSRAKLFQLLASGELKSIKIGRCRRIPESSLIEYIQQRQAAA